MGNSCSKSDPALNTQQSVIDMQIVLDNIKANCGLQLADLQSALSSLSLVKSQLSKNGVKTQYDRCLFALDSDDFLADELPIRTQTIVNNIYAINNAINNEYLSQLIEIAKSKGFLYDPSTVDAAITLNILALSQLKDVDLRR